MFGKPIGLGEAILKSLGIAFLMISPILVPERALGDGPECGCNGDEECVENCCTNYCGSDDATETCLVDCCNAECGSSISCLAACSNSSAWFFCQSIKKNNPACDGKTHVCFQIIKKWYCGPPEAGILCWCNRF